MSNNLHILGVAHTIPHEDYLACAFTAKVLLFPDVIQPFGWDVIEYSNEGSTSRAREHVVILSKERLKALSKRASREDPHDADCTNTPLQEEYQRILVEKIRVRAKPGDIVCHVWGPNMEIYNLLPNCRHVEFSVGYSASPGLPFRIYESSAWMHWHYGKAGHDDGNHYKWVIPSAFDMDHWTFQEEPENYALFLGRITLRKGMNELLEIARRTPNLPIYAHGQGDPSVWAKEAPPNLVFKGPIFGQERVKVVGRARCMLMPTVFIEPFGFSGIESQLCGVPLLGPSYGAFQETIQDGVTGYRCHTLADWVEAIDLSRSLDRRQIRRLAQEKYSKEVVGRQYDQAFRQLADLSGRGWYAEKSRKFGNAPDVSKSTEERQPRIWIYLPFFGEFPNYFQLYLDSLGQNADCLSVFLLTDNDLSAYRIPDNLVPIQMSLDALRERLALFVNAEFGLDLQPNELVKKPYKLVDFKIMYPEIFRDIADDYGVIEQDFVGWGDCDLIYGRFSDFINLKDDYQIIGGFHGHLTAVRNTDEFRRMFRHVNDLSSIILDEKVYVSDEIAFRQPMLAFLEKKNARMFYINKYFCDVVPECFYHLFREDYLQRSNNFFDVYNAIRDIDYLHRKSDGSLTVFYAEGDFRQVIYCHLQKRPMSIDFVDAPGEYYIHENRFSLTS